MKLIVIGGGIGGPLLALALQQHNISCSIFEARGQDALDGGFVALAPNALRVLDRVGVYDRIAKQGWNYEELQMLSSRNLSPIGTVLNGSQNKYGYQALRISRGVVRQTLLEVLRERDIELRYNSKCINIEETDRSTVITTFADGHTEEADFLVGADGIHSRVRSFLQPNATPKFSGQMGIGGSLERSRLTSSSQSMYMPCLILGKLNSFMLMPCTYTGDRVGCFATVESHDRSRQEWSQLQTDRPALYKALQSHRQDEHWPHFVHAASENIDESSLMLWPFYKVPELTSWMSRTGRVILVGDAAHAMPPTGGQGAAQAHEDAVTLADTLASLNDKDVDHLNVLRKWESTRQERVKKILAFTSKGGDMRKSSVSTFRQILKEWTMWAYFLWLGPDAGLSWIYDYDSIRDVVK
ncbi:salicylate hydroxylase [Exophiala viscosa]|uniref:salicylate hydroxylase n=1 Tax=Exophiala viscosa TaxID=2486360 RepID=UPI00219544A7|nr:salicylate hydroxylase [Exophiala viscosa]